MSRRWQVVLSLGASLGAIAAVVTAGALLREDAATDRAAPETTTTSSTTSTTTTTTTTTAPPPPPTTIIQPQPADLPPLYGPLAEGASGDVVAAYQQRFADLHFDPGPIDGNFGPAMTYAVHALQKIMGVPISGTITEAERAALETFQYPQPYHPDAEPNRTEIDVTGQVLTLFENYQPILITTVSTASGESYCYDTPKDNPTQRICEVATTPSGRYTYYFFYNGWHEGVLGELYNPYYFNKGIAVHGYESVPPYPASHGCARIPMHIAEYFHNLVHEGDPVYVMGGQDAQILSVEDIGGGGDKGEGEEPPPEEPAPIPPPGEPVPAPDAPPA
jgi:peptidoglycan hydrolase-like protein with peptidoglycan-binding domain